MAILVLILFLALLAAIVAVILAFSNPDAITVKFLMDDWRFTSSLAPLMLASFGVGALLGWLITVPSSIAKSLALAGNKKKIESLEKQLASKTYNLPKVDDAMIQAAQAKAEPPAAPPPPDPTDD